MKAVQLELFPVNKSELYYFQRELNNFLSWFEGYDLTEPMAIIHFTKFRY